jgi:hypothetical protein
VAPVYDPLNIGEPVAGEAFTTLASVTEFTFEDFNGETFPPSDFWTSYGVTDAGIANEGFTWNAATFGAHPEVTPIEGDKFIEFNAYGIAKGGKGVLITPQFTYAAGLQFSFWAYRGADDAAKLDSLNIYLTTSSDVAGLTPLKTVYSNYTLKQIESAAGWYYYTVDLTGATAGSKYRIALEGVSDFGHNIYVDGISVHAPFPALTSTATTPAKEATGVALSSAVSVTFEQDLPVAGTEPGKFNEAIAKKLVTIKDGANTLEIDNVSISSSDNKVLEITLTAPFEYEKTYRVHVPKAAIPGLTADVDWSFTTEAAPINSLNAVKASSAVYPTLSKGAVTVNTAGNATVKVVDLTGKVLEKYASTGHLPINLNYANGLYLIVVENGEGVTTHKVVLQK